MKGLFQCPPWARSFWAFSPYLSHMRKFCLFTEENECAADLFYRKQQKLPLPPAKATTYIYKNGY